MPLLMSSVQAGKQSHFQTETPLPTSGLDLTLLPHSSRLDDNGFGPRRTCAVVGGSGSLLAARHGAFIDAHQHVLRINRVRTRGFESHVGVRTTLNLFWGHPAHLEQWQAQQRVLSAAERARGLVVAVKAKDVLFFFEATSNLSRTGVAPPAPLLLMSDRVYGKAVEHLCRATDNGRQWATDCPIMRPSSGLLAVVFALQARRVALGRRRLRHAMQPARVRTALCGHLALRCCAQACRNVSLFGLTTGSECAPFHYFDPPPKPCTHAVPAKYDHPFHWFEREHAIYRGWARTRGPGRGTFQLFS